MNTSPVVAIPSVAEANLNLIARPAGMLFAFRIGMRPPRPIGQNICYHVRVQCNNREFRFHGDEDFALYRTVLGHYIQEYKFQLFDYTLMHTQTHLIINIVNEFTIDQVMRSINQVFARRYNHRHARTGHLWISPYKSSIIDSDGYCLCCMRYTDRNAPRAGMVQSPREWRWGGFNHYAYGQKDPLLFESPAYTALGRNTKERQIKYRKFVENIMPGEETRDKNWIQSRWPKQTHR